MSMTITVKDHAFAVVPGAHQRFWKRVDSGTWEPETFAIFDRHIQADTLFVDVGAWIGSTALYGVQRADRCIAFEPDPFAFLALQRNVAANVGADWVTRLEINDCAINKDGKSFVLGGRVEGASSMSSALFPDRDGRWTVRARRLQDVLSDHRKPGQPVFIKIDIEGGEYDLLPTIGEVIGDPAVATYVSFHPALLHESLAATDAGDQLQTTFVDRHLSMMDALPWTRTIALSDGSPVHRAVLERKLRKRFKFPTELLISGP